MSVLRPDGTWDADALGLILRNALSPGVPPATSWDGANSWERAAYRTAALAVAEVAGRAMALRLARAVGGKLHDERPAG